MRWAFLAALAAALYPRPAEAESFTSGGVTYEMDVYRPSDGKDHPLVVFVHGSDGMAGAFGPAYEAFAKELVGKGYVVAVPHYFKPGEVQADLGEATRYLAALTDAVDAAAALPGVEEKRVGLVGFSLGAALGVAYADASPKVKLGALVDFYGPVRAEQLAAPKTLPPTLILHFQNDCVVPTELSDRFAAALSKAGVTHEVKKYPDTGAKPPWCHVFQADGNEDKDARKRTAAWLARRL